MQSVLIRATYISEPSTSILKIKLKIRSKTLEKKDYSVKILPISRDLILTYISIWVQALMSVVKKLP